MMSLKLKILPNRHKDLPMPSYITNGAAGFDLVANESAALYPGETVTIGTGLAMGIPTGGYSVLICSRSGMALKHGVIVLNAPGVIDWDYRGEIKIILACVAFVSKPTIAPYTVNVGDRIAQAIFIPTIQAKFEIVEELSETARGDGGFGSTGR